MWRVKWLERREIKISILCESRWPWIDADFRLTQVW